MWTSTTGKIYPYNPDEAAALREEKKRLDAQIAEVAGRRRNISDETFNREGRETAKSTELSLSDLHRLHGKIVQEEIELGRQAVELERKLSAAPPEPVKLDDFFAAHVRQYPKEVFDEVVDAESNLRALANGDVPIKPEEVITIGTALAEARAEATPFIALAYKVANNFPRPTGGYKEKDLWRLFILHPGNFDPHLWIDTLDYWRDSLTASLLNVSGEEHYKIGRLREAYEAQGQKYFIGAYKTLRPLLLEAIEAAAVFEYFAEKEKEEA